MLSRVYVSNGKSTQPKETRKTLTSCPLQLKQNPLFPPPTTIVASSSDRCYLQRIQLQKEKNPLAAKRITITSSVAVLYPPPYSEAETECTRWCSVIMRSLSACGFATPLMLKVSLLAVRRRAVPKPIRVARIPGIATVAS